MGSMRQAGFTANVPMYVASGLLTYGANDGEQSVSFVVIRSLPAMWHDCFTSRFTHDRVRSLSSYYS